MKPPTVDEVINAYFEALRPSLEDVQALIEAWPVLTEVQKRTQLPEQEEK